jgi:hypothetical protein
MKEKLCSIRRKFTWSRTDNSFRVSKRTLLSKESDTLSAQGNPRRALHRTRRSISPVLVRRGSSQDLGRQSDPADLPERAGKQ